jgi:uncharacterized protein YoaH (UPF0181 family)
MVRHELHEQHYNRIQSIQMEDEVRNVLVTISNLEINSGDAKAMVRHELHEQHYNKIKRESTNSGCSVDL